MRKPFFTLFSVFLSLILLSGCGKASNGLSVPNRAAVKSGEAQFTAPQSGDKIAVFDTSLGEFRAVLFPDVAPMAVENFIGLAQSGYYDETVIWRSVADFVVEGGDASGEGTGGSTIWNGNGYPIEYADSLRHYAGALCMACDQSTPETGCYSAFYVVAAGPDSVDEALQTRLRDAGLREEVVSAYAAAGGLPYLDYTDTVFGQVYDGMEVVDAMALVSVDESSRPLEDIVIHSVTIETY